jgi:hypothetical protein
MQRALARLGVIAVLCACGGDELAEAPEAPRAGGSPNVAASASGGDPLLARARAAIRDGKLPSDIRAEILQSDAPAHARAKRILLAMEQHGGVVAPRDADTDAVADAEPPSGADPSAVPAEPPVVAASEPPAEAKASTPPVPKRPRPTLSKLALRGQGEGAVLDLVAGAGVLVGVVNQREQGIVRLVLEGVAANAKVLAARPSIAGARVTSVDAGPNAVRITLALSPGWAYDGVKKTASGARVRLRRTE